MNQTIKNLQKKTSSMKEKRGGKRRKRGGTGEKKEGRVRVETKVIEQKDGRGA